MKKYFIIFAMLFVSSFAQAQNPSICNPQQAYFQKHDGTGTLAFDKESTTKLNNAAIKLVQTIPDAQCANFKVVDYGFTPISQYTKGGYAEDFAAMKLDAQGAGRNDFYLLFAREVDQSNHCIKIWVDIRLPEEGKFACLTATQRSLVKIRVEKAVAKALSAGPANNPPTMNAELVGITTMEGEVLNIVNCPCDKGRNTCTLDCFKKDDKDLFFSFNGFKKYQLDIKSYIVKNTVVPREGILYEYSDVTVSNEGQDLSLNNHILTILQKIEREANMSVLAIITSDDNACKKTTRSERSNTNSDTFSEANNLFLNSDKDYKVWINIDVNKKDIYFVESSSNKWKPNFNINDFGVSYPDSHPVCQEMNKFNRYIYWAFIASNNTCVKNFHEHSKGQGPINEKFKAFGAIGEGLAVDAIMKKIVIFHHKLYMGHRLGDYLCDFYYESVVVRLFPLFGKGPDTKFEVKIDHTDLDGEAQSSKVTVISKKERYENYRVVYEVKTLSDENSPKELYDYIEEGVNQLKDRIPHADAGVLLISKEAFDKVYKSKLKDKLTSKISELTSLKNDYGEQIGFIHLESSLFGNTRRAYYSLIDKIKKI